MSQTNEIPGERATPPPAVRGRLRSSLISAVRSRTFLFWMAEITVATIPIWAPLIAPSNDAVSKSLFRGDWLVTSIVLIAVAAGSAARTDATTKDRRDIKYAIIVAGLILLIPSSIRFSSAVAGTGRFNSGTMIWSIVIVAGAIGINLSSTYLSHIEEVRLD